MIRMPMLKRFKSLKAKVLFPHCIITLGYPAVKALMTEEHRLLAFCDALTIVGGLLLVIGMIYSLTLQGDFNIAGFAMKRDAHSGQKQTYDAYRKDQKQKREDAFNYPLFLGFVYIVVSAFIAYVLL